MCSQTKQGLTDNLKMCNIEKKKSDELVINQDKYMNYVMFRLLETLWYQESFVIHCMKNTLTTCPGAPKYEDVIIKCIATKFRDTPYPGATIYSRYTAERLAMSKLQNVKTTPGLMGLTDPIYNDVTSFRYPISIPSCPKVNGRRNIFIAVFSAIENFEQRATIRRTWAMDLKVWNQSVTGFAGFSFILGQSQDISIQKRIEEENTLNKDIIQIDMIDVFRKRSTKMTGLLNWWNKNCSNFKGFFLKVDDDMYLNVRTLEYFIHSYDPFSPSMFGKKSSYLPTRGRKTFLFTIIVNNGTNLKHVYFCKDSNSKWDSKFDEWPWKEYPPYLLSHAFLLTHQAIVPLLEAIQTTPMFPFEDVYLSGICAGKVNVEIKDPYIDQNSM